MDKWNTAINSNKMFRNRIDAGRQLAQALGGFKDKEVVVLAIPRGGLPLASIVAREIDAPLDVVFTKKIGHPFNREYAIGAVSLEDIIISDAVGVTKSYINEESKRLQKKLRNRYNQYYRNRAAEDVKGKTVLIIDDGVATGNTILGTVELVKKQSPKKIVVAIPVAAKSAIQKLEASPHLDQIICLLAPTYFRSVGQFYEEFDAVSDDEAIQLLEKSGVNG